MDTKYSKKIVNFNFLQYLKCKHSYGTKTILFENKNVRLLQ